MDLDRAVALGATYYGLARKGRGIRIRAGVPQTYYIGIESAMPAVPGIPTPMKALCVVPFGMEEGSEAEIREKEFGLVVGDGRDILQADVGRNRSIAQPTYRPSGGDLQYRGQDRVALEMAQAR